MKKAGQQDSSNFGRFSFLLAVLIGWVMAFAVLPSASAMDYTVRRMNMVDKYLAGAGIQDPATLNAMRVVPRERFVPAGLQRVAYENRPLPIGYGQTISQPYVVGFMTEALQLKASDRVLEIGTGSGYQAAILAEIVAEVYTVEVVEPLGLAAAKLFETQGLTTIHTKIGDGYYGWPENAPYDGIIVTAAASHIPPPLIDQLKSGGRMIIPVGSVMMVQHLLLVEKDADGNVTMRSLLPVRFVPLTGGPGTGK